MGNFNLFVLFSPCPVVDRTEDGTSSLLQPVERRLRYTDEEKKKRNPISSKVAEQLCRYHPEAAVQCVAFR